MGVVRELTPKEDSRWTPIKLDHVNNEAFWLCKCRCGTMKVVRGSTVRNGVSKSCGCLAREEARQRERTHGHTAGGEISPEYQSWKAMKERCYNPNHVRYADYGGRGILVCARWKNSFENFFEDMGERPEGESLDRINPNAGYSPSNCRWATDKQQNFNRRKYGHN